METQIEKLGPYSLDIVIWFEENKENYFFRSKRDPYTVWISEVVLQQTRMAAAIEPLRRFLRCFPDVEQLANASEDKVLREFRGLGYYNRARFLRQGAKMIVKNWQGFFPRDMASLQSIPSIGPYTAAAIASFSFGQKVATVDGNVLRIAARLLGLYMDKKNPKLRQKAEQLILTWQNEIEKNKKFSVSQINEAAMELGQKICVNGQAKCAQCPLLSVCFAGSRGLVHKFPKALEKKKKKYILWQIFFVLDGTASNNEKKVLVQKWQDFYFFKGHIGLPSILYFFENSKELTAAQNKLRHSGDGFSGFFSHAITDHKISVCSHKITLEQGSAFCQSGDNLDQKDKQKSFSQKSLSMEKGFEEKDFFWVPLKELKNQFVPSILGKAVKAMFGN